MLLRFLARNDWTEFKICQYGAIICLYSDSSDTKCSWMLETTSDYIFIDVQDVKLQSHPLDLCVDDALEIYDGE